jgi:thymidylate synthase (FAD)
MPDTVKAWAPIAYRGILEYRLSAVTWSAQMLAVVRRLLAGEAVTQTDCWLNRRSGQS